MGRGLLARTVSLVSISADNPRDSVRYGKYERKKKGWILVLAPLETPSSVSNSVSSPDTPLQLSNIARAVKGRFFHCTGSGMTSLWPRQAMW